MTVDPLLIETAERIFRETCTFDAVEAAERDGWAPDVWDTLADAGLPWVGIAESSGGEGGTVEDALMILRIAGRFAAPIPLAETSLLGGWLLADAELPIPRAPITVVPGDPRDSLSLVGGELRGTAYGVPWADAADEIVTLVDHDGTWSVAVVPTSDVRVEHARDLAGEPRDVVHFESVVPRARASTSIDPAAFRRRGALTRVVLTAGALAALADLTIAYTSEREQFGRPVRRFQLVQAHLVHLAQDAELMQIASAAAVRAVIEGAGAMEIAAAKALALTSAQSAARSAHQAHGAMGMTREYPLHHLTRRLQSWCYEYGGEREWNLAVADHAIRVGPDDLYPLVAGDPASRSFSDVGR